MTSNKIVPYCKVVVGHPKLCFGKSIFPLHLSSLYVAESYETSITAKVADMGCMLQVLIVFSLRASNGSNAVVKFVKFWFS